MKTLIKGISKNNYKEVVEELSKEVKTLVVSPSHLTDSLELAFITNPLITIVGQSELTSKVTGPNVSNTDYQRAVISNIIRVNPESFSVLKERSLTPSYISELSTMIDMMCLNGINHSEALKMAKQESNPELIDFAKLYELVMKNYTENNMYNVYSTERKVIGHSNYIKQHDLVIFIEPQLSSEISLMRYKELAGKKDLVLVMKGLTQNPTFKQREMYSDTYKLFNKILVNSKSGSVELELDNLVSDTYLQNNMIFKETNENEFNEIHSIVNRIKELIEMGTPVHQIAIQGDESSQLIQKIINELEKNNITTQGFKDIKIYNNRVYKVLEATLKTIMSKDIYDYIYLLDTLKRNEDSLVLTKALSKYGNFEKSIDNMKKSDPELYQEHSAVLSRINEDVNYLEASFSKNKKAVFANDILVRLNVKDLIISDIKEKIISDVNGKDIWNQTIGKIKNIKDLEVESIKELLFILETVFKSSPLSKNYYETGSIRFFNKSYIVPDNTTYIFLPDFTNTNYPVLPKVNMSFERLSKKVDSLTSSTMSTYVDKLKGNKTKLLDTLTNSAIYTLVSISSVNSSGEEQKASETINLLNHIKIESDASASNLAYILNEANNDKESLRARKALSKVNTSTIPNSLRRAIKNAVKLDQKDMSFIHDGWPTRAYKDLTSFSVSRVESFYRCPMTYFLEKGLNIKEKEIFEENPMTMGSFFHEVINEYYQNHVIDKDLDVSNPDEFDSRVQDIIDRLVPEHNGGSLTIGGRNSYQLDRMSRRIKSSIWWSLIQLDNSEFKVKETEMWVNKDRVPDIVLPDGETVALVGIIDRLDVYPGDGKTARIIDYKSGDTPLNLKNIQDGKMLQLPVYAKMLENQYDIKGLYYFHLKDKEFTNKESDYDQLAKNYQMSGYTVDDDELFYITDKDMIVKREDGEYVRQGGLESKSVKIKFNKNGATSKTSNTFKEEEFNELIEEAMEVFKKGIMQIRRGFTFVNKEGDNFKNIFNTNPYKSIHHQEKQSQIYTVKEFREDGKKDE